MPRSGSLPLPYDWRHDGFRRKGSPPLIYEVHLGMAQEEERVGTWQEFTDRILPRIAAAGYNTLQLMAVQEHPYYGSFGYHVTSFFAASPASAPRRSSRPWSTPPTGRGSRSSWTWCTPTPRPTRSRG